MSYDASNRKSIRRAEKAADIAAANRIAYVKHIMSEPFGRAWMHDLLAEAGMFQEQFVPNNQYITAFNLGKSAIIKPVWALVFNYCPNEYILMMQEQATKELVNGRRDNDDAGSDPTTAAAGTVADGGRDDNRPSDADEAADDPARYVTETGFVDWNHKAR
jgi:hypothetical protein